MPVNITEVDAFTTPIIVPEAGDDRTASSVTAAFQALGNRTLHLKNRVDGLPGIDWAFSGSVSFNWELYVNGYFEIDEPVILSGAANEVDYKVPRVHGVALETPHNDLWIQDALYRRSTCITNIGRVMAKLPVPPGCTLKKVIATIDSGPASTPAGLFLNRLNVGTVAGPTSSPSLTSIGNADHSTSGGTEGVQVLCSELANETSYFQALIVANNNAAASPNHLLSLYCQIEYPGLRNG